MFVPVVLLAVLASLVTEDVDGLYRHRTPHYSSLFHYSHYSNSTRKAFRWGQMGNGDRNYCRRESNPSVRYGFIGKSTLDLDLPQYDRSPVGTIRYIEVFDMSRTRSGGYVCITRGGIGYTYVTLHMESALNQGMDFFIRVYGC